MITVKVKEKDKLKKVGKEVVMKVVINLMIYNNCLPKRATFLSHVLVKEFEETIVCTPPPPSSAGGFEPPTKFSKRAGLGRTSTFRGGC